MSDEHMTPEEVAPIEEVSTESEMSEPTETPVEETQEEAPIVGEVIN